MMNHQNWLAGVLIGMIVFAHGIKCYKNSDNEALTPEGNTSDASPGTDDTKSSSEKEIKPSSSTEQTSSSDQSTTMKVTSPADGNSSPSQENTEPISTKSTPKTTTFSTKKPEHICKIDPAICLNGGTCIENGHNFTCDCAAAFEGAHCEKIKWCVTYEGLCGSIPCLYDNRTNAGYCKCLDEQNQFFNVRNKTCLPLDSCDILLAQGNCSNTHETCLNGSCVCSDSYKYDAEGSNCIPDHCGTNCLDGEECKILNGKYVCLCKKNYHWNGKECRQTDLCLSMQCQQGCINGKCQCDVEAGFVLSNDSKTCNLKNASEKCNEPNKCGPGSCMKKDNTEICICLKATHIEQNNRCVDLCEAEKIPESTCPDNIKCKSFKDDGFGCKCEGKYKTAEDHIHCDVLDMCQEIGNKYCANKKAYCSPNFTSPEGYDCICQPGYEMNSNDICEHKCVAYTTCQINGAVCVLDSKYQPTCQCPPLFQTSDSSSRCEVLAQNSFIGKFSVKKARYKMPENFRGIYEGDVLAGIDQVKLKEDFEESLKSVYPEYQDLKILQCKESADEISCSVELQLNDKVSNGSLNIVTSSSVCVPITNQTDRCLLQPGLVIRRPTEKDLFSKTNPCGPEVLSVHCTDETKCTPEKDGINFKCTCGQGYEKKRIIYPATDRSTFIERCRDKDECLGFPCHENSTNCRNLVGSYECVCKDGYRENGTADPKEEGCIPVCDPNPCIHGSCHQTGKHGFACNCQGTPFSGHLCNETNSIIKDVKKKGDINNAIIGGILGSLLLLVIAVAVFLVFRLRKRNSEDGLEKEYASRRNPGVVSEGRMTRRDQTQGAEVRPSNRSTLERPRSSGDYRKEYRDSDYSIPRPHLKDDVASNSRTVRPVPDDGTRPNKNWVPKDQEENRQRGVQYRNKGFAYD